MIPFLRTVARVLLGAMSLTFTLATLADTAGKAPVLKMTTPISADITTPATLDTRLGTLDFFDGIPSPDTVDKVYEHLDVQRGVDVFLNAMPGASLYAMREGLRSIGVNNSSVALFETLMDSRSLFLTGNTESVYLIGWLDLKDGPMVVESPPNTLGLMDDFWFRYLTDMGNAGPDKGQGGKYLVLPPGYQDEVPAGYHIVRSPTYNVWVASRGFVVKGDPRPAVDNFKQGFRLYPLAAAQNPPATRFISASGLHFSTIHANNEKFYEEVNAVVQEEPAAAQDPELLGQLAAIGIVKGQPFAPDARMQKILAEAAAIGNATARTLALRPRDPDQFYYPGKAWFIMSGSNGSYLWLRDGARQLDKRSSMFYLATGVTPAMFTKMVGIGSQYALAALDAQQRDLDGGKTYKLHLPPNIPAKNFWSVVVYDTQTRSELQTNQQFPSLGSQSQNVRANADGSHDLYFGPVAPAGKESNWIQTVPGKSWFTILRLYGPLPTWFDKSWQPGEIELQK